MPVRTRLARLHGDERGGVAVYVSLALVALIGCVGIGFDTGRSYMVKSRLSSAVDAAALVGGQAYFEATRDADIQKYIDTNFPPSYMGATIEAPTINPHADGERITVETTATLPTTFMSLFGFQEVEVHSAATARRAVRQMELVLVMDNTGSMHGSKIDTMKSAAEQLVELVYGPEQTHRNLWVGLVPYTSTVNIGAQRTDWLDVNDRVFDSPDPFAPSDWKGCVEARDEPDDTTDAPPTTHPFTSFYYADDVDNDWRIDRDEDGVVEDHDLREDITERNDGLGPNLGCGPAITPLTQPKRDIVTAIRNMGAWHRGGTTSNLGLAWGWRVISPRWQGLWGGTVPNDRPLEYRSRIGEKVIVLLTDGDNQVYDWPEEWCWKGAKHEHHKNKHGCGNGNGPEGSDYTAYGRLDEFGYGSIRAAKEQLDRRMNALCREINRNDVKLYTITFGSSPDAETQALFRNCASRKDWYFHAPDEDDLDDVFRQIGQQLSNLRLSL
jgi:Flp pilus assembly protein TadG